MRSMLLLFTVLVLALTGPTVAYAHLTPNSEVQIDFGRDRVVLDIIIPQGEYAFATGNPVLNTPVSVSRATRFLEQNISLKGADGRKWDLRFDSVEFVQIAGPPDLHAIATAMPRSNATSRRFNINWSAILDTNPGHSVLFLARQDFSSGKSIERSEILGALQGERRVLSIDRGNPQRLAGFTTAVALGMKHIAKGHDHLLFLVALIITLPLVAVGAKWGEKPRSSRDTLWLVVKIATAFTGGHSVTLIGAALFNWQLPSQPIEILIAISILLSGIHAIRPIFNNREPAVAAGFGLVHGLAFATVVGGYGLDLGEKALTILGFNLGIELVQLLVIASILPALCVLARRPLYMTLRPALALFIMTAAFAWLVERITETTNPVTVLFSAILANGIWIVLTATFVALAVLLTDRKAKIRT